MSADHSTLHTLRGTSASIVTSLLASIVGCRTGPPPLTADMPLHLEDHLESAAVVGSQTPDEALAPVEWRFDEPQPEWRAVAPPQGSVRPVAIDPMEDALRLDLTEASRAPHGRWIFGGVFVDLPDYRLADWGAVLVRARTDDMVGEMDVSLNLHEQLANPIGLASEAMPLGDPAPVIGDGSVVTYALPVDRLYIPATTGDGRRMTSSDFDNPWRRLAVRFFADEPSTVDIVSVTLVPAEASYADAGVGVRTVGRDLTYRRTLYMHAPGRIDYRLRVPTAGRLDVGLGVVRDDSPVTFRITARPEGGDPEALLEQSVTDGRQWDMHAVDLSHHAGQVVTLSLEATAEREGSVALWAAPTVSGARSTEIPNVLFYVLDGGSSDHMSVYGYNRRTTPNIERLAMEGAMFERAYSNSTETWVSTPSFVTSLQSSVLRGYELSRMVPQEEVSMAERLHAAGYQTALLTDNPHAGWYSGLERGFDLLRDAFPSDVTEETSAQWLQGEYWSWRGAYPGEPYLLHLQSTEVHAPWNPPPPFAGLFLRPELRAEYMQLQWELLHSDSPLTTLEESGVDPDTYLNAVGALYDQAMAHQDFQIGQLVDRLKASGEWEHTLLIIAADHSHWAGGLRDPRLTKYDPMFRSALTRIPLVFVWPGHIAGGQRFSQPVSMIDVLPTILDLLGLPAPEVAQGQSLAPLLLGTEGWEPRPVILDEFRMDPATGELGGVIEVIDGRWGASLLRKPRPGAWPESVREVPLLLYDLWDDPYTRRSLHEERPDLVEHYTAFLEAQYAAHRSLAQLFTRSDPLALTPEQLQTLRSLGYIR